MYKNPGSKRFVTPENKRFQQISGLWKSRGTSGNDSAEWEKNPRGARHLSTGVGESPAEVQGGGQGTWLRVFMWSASTHTPGGPLPALPHIYMVPDLLGTGEGNGASSAACGGGHYLQHGTLYSAGLYIKCDDGTNTFQTSKKLTSLATFLSKLLAHVCQLSKRMNQEMGTWDDTGSRGSHRRKWHNFR